MHFTCLPSLLWPASVLCCLITAAILVVPSAAQGGAVVLRSPLVPGLGQFTSSAAPAASPTFPYPELLGSEVLHNLSGFAVPQPCPLV